VDFEETWEILYGAFVTGDDIGVVAAGVEEGFASSYTIVDTTSTTSISLIIKV
jgi:hypothetical protein